MVVRVGAAAAPTTAAASAASARAAAASTARAATASTARAARAARAARVRAASPSLLSSATQRRRRRRRRPRLRTWGDVPRRRTARSRHRRCRAQERAFEQHGIHCGEVRPCRLHLLLLHLLRLDLLRLHLVRLYAPWPHLPWLYLLWLHLLRRGDVLPCGPRSALFRMGRRLHRRRHPQPGWRLGLGLGLSASAPAAAAVVAEAAVAVPRLYLLLAGNVVGDYCCKVSVPAPPAPLRPPPAPPRTPPTRGCTAANPSAAHAAVPLHPTRGGPSSR